MDGWLNKHVEGGHLPFMEPPLTQRKYNKQCFCVVLKRKRKTQEKKLLCFQRNITLEPADFYPGCIMTITVKLDCRTFNNDANVKSFELSGPVLLSELCLMK